MSTSASPRRRIQLTHHRALDGLRGLAVTAVLLYHGGVSWASGGFLGVEVFFVLSGFLITSLLVAEWARAGSISLRAFWARRARRLLPALFVLVAVIGIYYALAGPDQAIPGFLGDGISTLLYAGNWHQLATGAGYFAASGPVSPFQHTWSLAIEEQFYILWPLVVLAVVTVLRLRGVTSPRRSLSVLLGMSVAGAVASAVETALLFHGGRGLERVYYGTDTRAASLLTGAALAFALALRRGADAPAGGRSRPARRALPALSASTILVLPALLVALRSAGGSASWLYPYGMLAVDGGVVVLILAAVHAPASPGARVLAVAPLRFLGNISYGLYLWHFPLFLWLDESSTGLSGATLLALRLGVTVAVAIASYALVEQPIRQRRRPSWLVRGLAPVAAAGAVASLLVAASAAALPQAVPAAVPLPRGPAPLSAGAPACPVTLTDLPGLGRSPLPAAREATFEYSALGGHALTWRASSTKTFATCSPAPVLVVGDSIAFTLGVPMMSSEQRYGVELANGALLGCAFTTTGQLDVNGTWQGQSPGCAGEVGQWQREEQAIHAREVIVELGYRDEFDWLIGGRVQHLGQPTFDRSLQGRIDHLVSALSTGGAKVLLLTVPYTNPPARADGSPAPAASPARHAMINGMLRAAAARDPGSVSVVDIDRTLSPAGHYTARINGQMCRFDGVHLTVYCSELVEPSVLGDVRRSLG